MIKDASLYEEEIQLVSLMRMDFELLEEIIEDLDESDSKIMKQYLLEGRLFKEIVTMKAEPTRLSRNAWSVSVQKSVRKSLNALKCKGGE